MLVPLPQQTVQSGLGVTAAWEIVDMQVGVLKRDESLPLALKVPKGDKAYFIPGSSKVGGKGQSVAMLARLLAT
ncbi:hypothetical protein ES703_33124 [subsurface metagenome]